MKHVATTGKFVEGEVPGVTSMEELREIVMNLIEADRSGVLGIFHLGSDILERAQAARRDCPVSLIQIGLMRDKFLDAMRPEPLNEPTIFGMGL